jgi:hypothetical protein
MSTLVPVLGITYRRHSASLAKASAGMKIRTLTANKRGARIKQSPVRCETIESIEVRSRSGHF